MSAWGKQDGPKTHQTYRTFVIQIVIYESCAKPKFNLPLFFHKENQIKVKEAKQNGSPITVKHRLLFHILFQYLPLLLSAIGGQLLAAFAIPF